MRCIRFLAAGGLVALATLTAPASRSSIRPNRSPSSCRSPRAGRPMSSPAWSASTWARTLGTTFVVENIGGAGGSLGMTRAAQAAPDGYTIAVGNMGTQSAAPALYPNLKYDPAKSFAQIGIVNYTPQAVVSKKALTTDEPQGIHRLREGQGLGDQLRPCRRRLDLPCRGPRLQRQVRAHAQSHSLSRHRSGAAGHGGRADRLHRRPVAQRHSADQGRHHQGLCDRRARAAGEPAGCADHQGGRRGFHLQRLERHGGAQGHAEGHRRKARRRARARRSTIRRSRRAMSSSAARRRRARNAGRRACRSSSRARWRASRR